MATYVGSTLKTGTRTVTVHGPGARIEHLPITFSDETLLAKWDGFEWGTRSPGATRLAQSLVTHRLKAAPALLDWILGIGWIGGDATFQEVIEKCKGGIENLIAGIGKDRPWTLTHQQIDAAIKEWLQSRNP